MDEDESPSTVPEKVPSTTQTHEQHSSTGQQQQRRVLTPGIVYLSRIPPYMKPLKVRHVFSRYGTVGRVYLQPEDPLVYKRRKKLGGNKKRKYTEGWVEFTDKHIAKWVAEALNNRPVGGKKSSYYHDDLWNIKYLSKFRWTHLTEKIAYENAVREQRLRTEMSQAKRENTHYLESVEKSKAVSAIVERKRRTGKPVKPVEQDPVQRFKQRRVEESIPSRHTGRRKGTALSDALLKKVLP